jgi:hypothetical protein
MARNEWQASDELAMIEDWLRSNEMTTKRRFPVETQELVLQHLTEILDEMQEMAPLPSPLSREGIALGDGWDKRYEEIEKKYKEAVEQALLCLPAPVTKVFDQIRQQKVDLVVGTARKG